MGIKNIIKNISRMLILLVMIHISSVSAANRIYIKPQIDADSHLYKPIHNLARQMEDTAKDLKTTNQTDYWESEGRRLFQKMLESFGYYEAIIEVESFDDKGRSTLNFLINPGNRYKVNNVSFKFIKNSNRHINNISLDQLRTKSGDYVDVIKVQRDQKIIQRYVEENNCLLNLSVSHQAIIDHFYNTVDIVFLLDTGPEAKLEKIIIQGLTKTSEDHVRRLIKLKEGQCFKQSFLLDVKNDLQESNLFSSVNPEIPNQVNAEGSVPVIFNLQERKARSINLGASYGTDFGFGGAMSWKHRNFFGNGENVSVKLDGNQVNQTFETIYEQPFFLLENQKLRFENKYENEVSKSFNNKEVNTAIFIDRKINSILKLGVGGKLAYYNEKDFSKITNQNQDFALFSFPLYMEIDQRDDIVDSQSGYLLRFEAIPYNSTSLNTDPFVKLKAGMHTYYSLHQRLTLALKAASGLVLTEDSNEVPISEKIFAGGSTSIRGYGYNLAGDLNSECIPIGGKSLLELSAEFRLRLKNKIGFVSFVDSGYAYQSTGIKMDKLLYGVGVGFRYYTDFGPLRIDVAMPVKKRCNIDQSIQYYFGIGQSF